MKRKTFSVYQVNGYIKSLLDDDLILNNICIRAEVSNLTYHSSGHIYFTLKDDKASIRCVMFKNYCSDMTFMPENGVDIIACGNISSYEKTGQYQLYVKSIEPCGAGSLYIAFEQLKAKLSNEGIFNSEFKKPIPKYAASIAIITSPTGAAIQDVISVCKRRNKNVELVIVPTIVQGEAAEKSIIDAISDVNKWNGCDVIILCRGGGSIEDLWAFNKEDVARSIFSSAIPVISAVGHETDFTISDFAADMRAATPSAAAELATYNLFELNMLIKNLNRNLMFSLKHKLNQYKQKLLLTSKSISLLGILNDINKNKNDLKILYTNLNNSVMFKILKYRQLLENKETIINSISPFSILKKGFAILEDKNGNLIKNMSGLNENDIVKIKLNDGEIKAQVMSLTRRK